MTDTAPLRILHIASHEINVGDGALNSAIQQTIRKLHGRAVNFVLEDVAVFRRDLTAADVADYDLVVVGGGGSISNGPNAARNGTALPMSLEEYGKATTPFAFVGLGHNIFSNDEFRHVEALKSLLALAEAKGDPFSVRNDGSLARLQRDLGDAARSIVEIPDPGFFVDSPPLAPLETSHRPYLLIQLAGDALNQRVKESRLTRALRRLRSAEPVTPLNEGIATFALDMWHRHGLDILFAPHITHDVPICSAILKLMYAKAGPAALHRPFRMGGTPHPIHAQSFFGGYAGAALIVGMRGHAVICGVGLRRPVIALSTHPKVVGFMEDCGLGAWSVSLGKDLGAALSERASALLADESAYFASRDMSVGAFATRFEGFLSSALATVGTRRNG